MFYLDDNIEMTVDGFNISTSGVYRYDVIVDTKTIFIGNCYLSAGDTSHTFYLNDILNTQRSEFENAFKPSTTYTYRKVNICSQVVVALYINNLPITASDYVAFAYRYPNRKSYLEKNILPRDEMTEKAINFLQGSLLPHIPYISTDNFPLLNVMQYGVQQYKYFYNFEGDIQSEDIEASFNSEQQTLHKYPLSQIFSSAVVAEPKSAVLTFNSQNEPTWSNNVMISSRTATSVSGEVQMYDETLVGIGRCVSGFEVYAGDEEILLTSGENIPSKDSWNLEFTVDDWNNVSDNLITIYFYYSYGGQITHHGHMYITDRVDFSGQNKTYKLSFITHYDESEGVCTLEDFSIKYAIAGGQKEKLYDVATIDFCPANYYLIWQDRLGGYQSQPFEKTETFSESFDYKSIINYKHEKKHIGIDIVPKWNLNTGFISSELYPYYESIFTSPQLLLYDTREDKSYIVNVTDTNYTEKTYKNQSRKMFNLTINVELNKSQIIYQ